MKRLTPALSLLLAVGATLFFGAPAMAAGHKVVVLNSTSDPITLRLTTAAGTPIYNGSWTLKRGDRYELSNINEIILVTVESAKCGTLKAELARGADWNVDVKAAGTGCELIKVTKSKM